MPGRICIYRVSVQGGMRVKRTKALLTAAAQQLDVPQDVLTNAPRVEVMGFQQVTVEHHRGVTEYTEDAVTVAVADGAVRITGAGLTISLMNQGFVTVCGNVADVALLPGGCP